MSPMQDRLDEIVKRQRRHLRVLGVAGIGAGLVAIALGIAAIPTGHAQGIGTGFLMGLSLIAGGIAGLHRSFKK